MLSYVLAAVGVSIALAYGLDNKLYWLEQKQNEKLYELEQKQNKKLLDQEQRLYTLELKQQQ